MDPFFVIHIFNVADFCTTILNVFQPTDDNDKQYAHLLSIRLTEINTVVLSGDKKSFDIKTNTGTLAIQAANKEESDTFTWFSTFQRLIREQKEAFLKQAFKI